MSVPCFLVIFVIDYNHSTLKIPSLEFPKTLHQYSHLSWISLLVVISVNEAKTEWFNEDWISVSLLEEGLQGKHSGETGHISSVPLHMPFLYYAFNR